MIRISGLILALLLLQQPAPVNVGGEWGAVLSLPLGDTNYTLYIDQKGTALTGYMLNETGQYDVKGTVAKDQVRFQWEQPDRAEMLTFAFSGKLDGRTLNGSIKVANVEGTLFAQRR